MTDGAPVADVRWRLLTPSTAPGAVAAIGLESSSDSALDAALGRLGLGTFAVGQVALRSLAGRESALVARWTGTCLHVMPHGGAAVIREVTARLSAADIPETTTLDATAIYPEARSRLETFMLHALACAQSPLAVDLLLDQPRRWRSAQRGSPTAPVVLDRLINPPLVAAIGPSNIGKSTLVNALAGRCVSIVADEPGTTRDHVGVTLDLGGLVVRYADTPGLRDTLDPIELRAQELTQQLIARADLILLMGDAASPPPPWKSSPVSPPTMRVALRSDLGPAAWPHDAGVCAVSGTRMADLVSAIRDRLVPPSALADPKPWAFWNGAGLETDPFDP